MAGSEIERRHPASFRDPRGYIFHINGVLHRAITAAGEPDFEALLATGLYGELSSAGLLVRHVDVDPLTVSVPVDARRVVRPEFLPLVSYAAEWTFSQLRAAALLTLDIEQRALAHGLSLRDASNFNVQFVGTRPVFIDTLSLGRTVPDRPWVAYRQFCEHFLAPLALLAWHGHRISALWSAEVEGVPLSIAARLLPLTSWLHPGVALHLHLHAWAAERARVAEAAAPPNRPYAGFRPRLVASLRRTVERLRPLRGERTAWEDYRLRNSYTAEDTRRKVDFVRACATAAAPSRAIDLGANDGLYAALLADSGIAVTAVDADAMTCEAVFHGAAQGRPGLINVARIDLANPTPSFGAGGVERSNFVTRYHCDFVLALALVHHLSITKQIPYRSIAQLFAALGPQLVVEYVPPNDPMAARLLAARPGEFDPREFSEEAFLAGFAPCFDVLRRSDPSSNGRVLFWMRRRRGEPVT